MDAKKFKKQMADLKPGDGVSVGDTKYEYGADLATEGVPLIDEGRGKTMTIRTFTFKIKPENLLNFSQDKQSIFNSHARQISTTLWGDGLVPYEEVPPRVILDTNKGIYRIFVVCEAKHDVSWMESPSNLSKLLSQKLDSAKN